MSKGFAQSLSETVPRLTRTCRRANRLKDQVFPFWDSSSRRYIYNLVTKEKYSDKPDLQTLATTLESMQPHQQCTELQQMPYERLDVVLNR